MHDYTLSFIKIGFEQNWRFIANSLKCNDGWWGYSKYVSGTLFLILHKRFLLDAFMLPFPCAHASSFVGPRS